MPLLPALCSYFSNFHATRLVEEQHGVDSCQGVSPSALFQAALQQQDYRDLHLDLDVGDAGVVNTNGCQRSAFKR